MRTETIKGLGVLLLAASALESHAQDLATDRRLEQDRQRLNARWDLGFGIGTDQWDSLAGTTTQAGGDFHRSGRSISGRIHHRLNGTRFLYGGETGVLINRSSIDGALSGQSFSDEVTAWTGYIGPSLRWLIGSRERASLDFGLARYKVDVTETACMTDDLASCFDQQYFENDAFGSFIGFTGEFPLGRGGGALSLSVRAHQFDVGEATVPRASETVRFDGPVITMQIGWTHRIDSH